MRVKLVRALHCEVISPITSPDIVGEKEAFLNFCVNIWPDKRVIVGLDLMNVHLFLKWRSFCEKSVALVEQSVGVHAVSWRQSGSAMCQRHFCRKTARGM